MSAEAWKDTGKCGECRRKGYCKKKCSAHKKMVQTMAKAMFIKSSATGRMYAALDHLTGGEKDG